MLGLLAGTMSGYVRVALKLKMKVTHKVSSAADPASLQLFKPSFSLFRNEQKEAPRWYTTFIRSTSADFLRIFVANQRILCSSFPLIDDELHVFSPRFKFNLPLN